jgi:4-hydroxybenzoate polyprenyltransferase
MTEHDELRELWTSQPLQDWKGKKVPRFALLDDEVSSMVSRPLSKWNKVGYLIWPTYVAVSIFREMDGPPTPLAGAAMAVFLLSAIGMVVYMFLHRDKSRAPKADESVAEYRAACLTEMERQYEIERRAMIFSFTGFVTAAAMFTAAAIMARALPPIAVLGLAAFAAVPILVFRTRRRYWARSLDRLRRDLEDVQ